MFTNKDLKQLESKGISSDLVNWQIQQFEQGVAPIKLARHAAVSDGILRIPDTGKYMIKFDEANEIYTKFVPASGAASRMFKDLFEAIDTMNGSNEEEVLEKSDGVKKFFAHTEEFAFYSALDNQLEEGIHSASKKDILNALLQKEQMEYGSLPKGLLAFHKYADKTRTPFEEHMVEGARYAKDSHNNIRLHFTVSPEHKNKFMELLERVRDYYEMRFGVQYQVEFSVQEQSTDTLSVDMNNQPFREEDGSMLFRPGGHGALINNLNKIDSDIIFIKNIDNVVPEHHINDTITYKKVLAGVLIGIQKQIFEFQEGIENGLTDELRGKILEFYQKKMYVDYSQFIEEMSESEVFDFFKSILFRPIRACGVVKNEGEPGGGPFWVISNNQLPSLQIVESSQVNTNDKEQMEIFKQATHFNPVDLVCAVKNYEGEKYNLLDFVDSSTCFISSKSKNGKELKALELPGLWNGAMANWNTIFVEVPISTFNPVKTVNDLLRPAHQ